jgi:hypothetical protein
MGLQFEGYGNNVTVEQEAAWDKEKIVANILASTPSVTIDASKLRSGPDVADQEVVQVNESEGQM